MARADKKAAVGLKKNFSFPFQFYLSYYTVLPSSSFTPLELRVVKLSQILYHLSANVKFTAVATR